MSEERCKAVDLQPQYEARFDPPACPECGQPPDSVVEHVIRMMDVRYYLDGSPPELDEVDWESSAPAEDADGRWTLHCGADACGCEWAALYVPAPAP